MSDWWNQPTPPEVEPEAAAVDQPASCPWCGAPSVPAATHCASCGAVMAQREDLGGLLIPGVTAVDPGLQVSAAASTLTGAQSRFVPVSLVGSVGGTSAQIAVAAAILARDHFSSGRREVPIEQLGNPSQAALDMAERLRREGAQEIPAVDRAAPNGANRPGASTQEPAPDGTGSSTDKP